MSSEEDQEVFEITDFTTASDWERFIARIEEVVHEWKLPQRGAAPPLKKGELSTGEWVERREQLMFASFQFEAVHHMLLSPQQQEEPTGELHCLADMMSRENDFPPKAHCLVRWYGLREFVVIHPAKANDSILTEDRARMLLSSVSIAINNTNCQVPVFVQLQQMRQKFFLGVCEGGGGVRTNFDMVHLHRPFPQFSHLAGLLQLFKDKVAQCTGVPCSEPVSVAVRFTYVLQDWSPCSWPQPPPEIDELGEDITPTDIGRLPCGALEDPVLEFHLSVTWPQLSELAVVDNDVHSDLVPTLSPKWSMRLKTSEKPSCSMADYLRAFHNLSQSFYSESPLLGTGASDELDNENSTNITHALDRLAGPGGRSLGGRGQHQAPPPVIGEEVLIRILQYIFPDSAPPPQGNSEADEWKDSFSDSPASPKIQEQLRSLKSAPADSLTWRLALAVCHAAHCFGGLPAVAQLWRDFLLEMRHRWENNYTLPCLDPGTPNLNFCLLHQKLQMLNCCIERKKSREWLAVQPPPPASDSDEEFFECLEADASVSSVTIPHNKKPEGRLRQLGDAKLLRSDEPLYIPCTQEPAPVTEDVLSAQAEALERLGTDAEGAALRARMQAACLLSDIEAFKAANPRGALEDFVRWYSPRDLVEEKDQDGNVTHGLSARMRLPGNMWLEAWDSARPIPARRQKRLFDDTKEAEKVLHFLASVKTSEVVLHLMPMLVHCAILQLAEEEEVPVSLPLKLEETALKAAKVTRSQEPKYEGVLRCLHDAECMWACLSSVRTKLLGEQEGGGAVGAFSLRLLEQEEAEVPAGPKGVVGQRIRQLFAEAHRASTQLVEGDDQQNTPSSEFPAPCGKEFLLRCPAGPHRLYAVLTREEFRLAGAFSQDTTFL